MPIWGQDLTADAAAAAAAADAKATTALANAATAQTTANTAVTNAATAQSTANTARVIAGQKIFMTRFDDLRGATAQVRRFVWPYPSTSGFGVRMDFILDGNLATGDLTFTLTIEGAATAPVSKTIALAAGLTNSKHELVFTGSNSIPAGARLVLTAGGANTALVGGTAELFTTV